ncbi:MAG: hypothetical protein A2030_02010 [Chloroflexi bacterium RBG_19FT_COMBO_50_10]|nr:MAG: hypothetical protein A2030_02010 [Chloroflexi bacterium RBG_19FT_COMBO_50_10]
MNSTLSDSISPRISHFFYLALIFLLLLLVGQSTSSTSLAAFPNTEAVIAQNVPDRTIADQPMTPFINNNAVTLFYDDFSGDLSNWSVEYGNWYIEQEALVGDAYDYPMRASIYAGDPAWTDYVFQTQVVTQTLNTVMFLRSSEPWQNEYCLEFRWDGSSDSPNTYYVSKFQDGVFYELTLGYVESPVPITSSSLLTVLISGNHMVIYIDDQYVTEIVDANPIPNGRIGLGVLWDTATFDDVLVSTVPPVMVYPQQERKFAEAGDTITYTLELVNHTGLTDSFDLEILPGNVWTTTLSTDQVGPVAEGGSITFTTWVDVPTVAIPGDNSTARIQATSVTSPTVYTTTAILNTTAFTSTLAYVSAGDYIVLVDTGLHIPVDSIDLTQYDCMLPQQVKFTPNLDQLYVYCTHRNKLLVFDTSDNTYLATITLPTSGYHGDMTFTRDGAYVVVGADDSDNVYVIDTATFTIIKTVHTVFPMGMDTHPYLPQIYIGGYTCCYYGYVQVLDTTTFTIVKTIRTGWYVHDVQVSPDGQWLYASDSAEGGGIYKIDPHTNAIVGNILGNWRLSDIKLTPDSSKLFAIDYSNEAIAIFDATNFTYLTSIWIGVNAQEMELTCDGSELWMVNALGTIPVLNTLDYTIPYHIPMPYGEARGIAMCSPVSTGIFVRKIANKMNASPGELVDFTLSFYNYGVDDVNDIVITDTLPAFLNYVEGSLHASSGIYDHQNGVITWTGDMTSTYSVDVTFQATIAQNAAFGTSITNSVIFNTPTDTYTRSSIIEIVPYFVYMPCTSKACGPTYFDNFSNPDSGWPIGDNANSKLGYLNGEYQILVKPAGRVVFAYHDFGINDYRVELDARPASHLYGGVGIIFDITDDGFYLYEINDGWYSLWRYNSGDWAEIIPWRQSASIQPGYASNHMEVVRIQSEIRLYVNDHWLVTTNDGTYHGGVLGMQSDSFYADFDGRFDNFTVTTGVCIDTRVSMIAPSNDSGFETRWMEQASGTIQR